MENEERVNSTAEPKEPVLPAARAEHITAMAKAIAESAPNAETLQNFKTECEQTRIRLHEAEEAGEEGIPEAEQAIDTAIVSLARTTLEKQTAHVAEYDSLSAALHAQADRQAALEILEVSVPLIRAEEVQDEALTEAMAYCRLQQMEELVYSVDGVKNRLPVYKTTAEAAERVRGAFVNIYNHQPSRQRMYEEMEDACKAEAEKEKIEKSGRRAARGAYRHEIKTYMDAHPEAKKQQTETLLRGLLFLIPAAVLLVLLLCGLFKGNGRAVFACVLLFVAGLAGAGLWLRKKLTKLYAEAEKDSEELKTAAGNYHEAEKRVREQKESVRTAIRRFADFRKTFLH